MNFKKKKKKIADKIYERMSRNQIKLSRVRILWYLFFSVIFDNNHGRNKSWTIPILSKFHQMCNKTYFDKKPFLRQAASLS